MTFLFNHYFIQNDAHPSGSGRDDGKRSSRRMKISRFGGSLDQGLDKGQDGAENLIHIVRSGSGDFSFSRLSTELFPSTGPPAENRDDDNPMKGGDEPLSFPDPVLMTSGMPPAFPQDSPQPCEYPRTEENSKDVDTGQKVKGEASYVCEATFYIRVATNKRRPQTTSSLQGLRAGRLQRQRRRQLQEQLLRQQLAAVDQVWRRTAEPRHEGPAVKRLVEAFNKAVTRQIVGLRTYTGGYTFQQLAAYIGAALEDVTTS
jgi:hypothetical protein